MPKKSDRRAESLPAGLLPLLTQRELETYYGVSDWTVLKWIEAGMPVKRLANTGQRKEVRRFALSEVEAWMAEHNKQLAATA
ncbi:helix-turn-helix transcriptional regulator [Streptomyces sp. NPDC057257]|uniref:helix-turn-helix transcriptional regulator n=1 Tax=Streptomyces sp. NPDC057257 TaxID=3346071 RepID=UPI00362EF5BC